MSRLLGKLRTKKPSTEDDNSNTSIPPPIYAPPPGPPPTSTHTSVSSTTIKHDRSGPDGFPIAEPPSNPVENPPPYHDWTSIPDTSLLPPPPPLQSDYSSTSNASYDDAAAAHAWCAQHPVYTPQVPSDILLSASLHGQHDIDPPPGFRGICRRTENARTGSAANAFGLVPGRTWRISTSDSTSSPYGTAPPPSSSGDQIFLSRLPLYFAAAMNPLLSNTDPTLNKNNNNNNDDDDRSKSDSNSNANPATPTVYFEITPLSLASSTATIAIGYAAKPYPANRQPGWHRASLAVHSDDGHRFTNDPWAGRDFVPAFRAGQSLGLALRFDPSEGHLDRDRIEKSSIAATQISSWLPRVQATRAIFMRDGVEEGSWRVDEERDAERDEGAAGLYGEVDLYAAIGVWGDVDFEVRFFGLSE